MRTVVIGTAGHIDHGKTALVKALTGVDTDRLEEEQRRGITIDLGFAHLDLSPDLRASVVDVPGHERFVKNMVAGTGGIDLVLLVVAADEGAMPQTREHLDICRLLGVTRGVVALTKIDLVSDREWLKLVQEDLRRELAESPLAEAPMVLVSSRTGEGLEALRQVLLELGRANPERPSDGATFLAIDRAFSMQGFGTVVTGTLTSGRLELDASVDILPDPSGRLRALKIRGLQCHGQAVERALAGQRAAVNLAGVERTAIERGQVLVESGWHRPGQLLEASLTLLPLARPLRNRTRLLLHTGTAKTSAGLELLQGEKLAPGATGLARLRCEQPLIALGGQHFILRGFQPLEGRGTTLGGGRFLTIHPPRRRQRDRSATVAELERLQQGDLAERLSILLGHTGSAGADARELAVRSGAGVRAVEHTLQQMLTDRRAVQFDRERARAVSISVLAALGQRARELLTDFHLHNPMLPGMGAEQLRASLESGGLDPKLFRRLLAEAEREGWLRAEGETTRLAEHRVQLDAAASAIESRVLEAYRAALLSPPRLEELTLQLGVARSELLELVQHLARSGGLVHISGEMYVEASALADLQRRLVEQLQRHETMDTQAFKQLVGATRKHAIPLAEYFDRQKITLRVGEVRRLRRSADPAEPQKG